MDSVDAIGNTPLHAAIVDGHVDIVKILLARGANANATNNIGVTPLYRAAAKGYLTIVKELMKVKDIKVNAADNEGTTALFCAACSGNLNIVQELLKAEDINVNSLTYQGESPLEVTEILEIRELLMRKGAFEFGPILRCLERFIAAVNTGELSILDLIVSENNVVLKQRIQSTIQNGFFYRFNPSPIYNKVEFINPSKVKISGIFTASGKSATKLFNFTWELNGLSNYFLLENQNNEWLITETDFPAKLSMWFSVKFLILFGFIFIFWLWMLIDCFNRNFKNKGRWFIILLFFNIISAIIYFFRIKIRNVRTEGPII